MPAVHPDPLCGCYVTRPHTCGQGYCRECVGLIPCTVALRTAEDVTAEVIDLAYECAEAAYGLGNDFRIDWERAYDMLESQGGWFVAEMGSPADRRIRAAVNRRRRAEGMRSAE